MAELHWREIDQNNDRFDFVRPPNLQVYAVLNFRQSSILEIFLKQMNKALIDQMILETEPYVWIMSSVNRAVISPTKSLIYKVLALMIWIQRNRFKPNRTKVYQRYLKIAYYMYLSIS